MSWALSQHVSRRKWELVRREHGECARNANAPILASLIRLHCLQRLLAHLPASAEGAEQCLHHVLLWQYLSRRNVMHLIELTLAADERTAGSQAGGGSAAAARERPATHFLETLGVPMCRRALAQVRIGMVVRHGTSVCPDACHTLQHD